MARCDVALPSARSLGSRGREAVTGEDTSAWRTGVRDREQAREIQLLFLTASDLFWRTRKFRILVVDDLYSRYTRPNGDS